MVEGDSDGVFALDLYAVVKQTRVGSSEWLSYLNTEAFCEYTAHTKCQLEVDRTCVCHFCTVHKPCQVS